MEQHGRVVIIGGGGTGAALSYDLALRGFDVVLLERGEFTSGTTGRHHGQLHSGARYAVGDREIARECMDEVRILQRIAPQSIEMNYGLFVALNQEDLEFGDTFVQACREATIPVKEVALRDALAMEPNLNPDILRAVQVPDGTIDAFRLPLQFLSAARIAGARVFNFSEVTGIHVRGGTVTGVRFHDHRANAERDLPADIVVNATGAWAGKVAELAGVKMAVTPAPGTMVAVNTRLNNMVISHLHPAGDGDIIVPQRTLSIIGSTQWQTEDPDDSQVPEADIEYLRGRAAELIPAFPETPFHAAWTAPRPLAGRALSVEDGRKLSRDFLVVDHGKDDNVANFLSVVGGKATVLRAMAEQAADYVCKITGIDELCTTADRPLPTHRSFYNPRLQTETRRA